MKMELMVLNFGGLSEEKRIKNQKKIERKSKGRQDRRKKKGTDSK